MAKIIAKNGFLMALLAIAATALVGVADASAKQKLPSDQHGLEHCILQDDGENEEVLFGDNRCCYEDEVAPGEYLTMCVQCDENWENCEEAPGTPRVTTSPGGGISTGTISPPRNGPQKRFPFRAHTGATRR